MPKLKIDLPRGALQQRTCSKTVSGRVGKKSIQIRPALVFPLPPVPKKLEIKS
jgi:hypothetical protein